MLDNVPSPDQPCYSCPPRRNNGLGFASDAIVMQADAYGMVEELLELSRRLSVQTIRDFVAAVHRRIPAMFRELLA